MIFTYRMGIIEIMQMHLIDTLTIAQQLWVLLIESKSTIAFSVALPQLMTYMRVIRLCVMFGSLSATQRRKH